MRPDRSRPGALLAVAAVALALLVAPQARARDYTPGQERYVEGVRAFDRGDYAAAAGSMRAALAEDGAEGTSRFRHKGLHREGYFPHLYLGLSLEKLGEKEGARKALLESRRQGAVAARPSLARLLAAALLRLAPPTPEPPTPTATAIPVLPLPAPTLPPPVASPTPFLPPTPAVPSPGPPTVRGGPTPAPAPAGVEGVRSGIRAFFQGDYASAEVLLSPEAPRSPVARLFLSYALAGRWLLGGGTDEALALRAHAEHGRAIAEGAAEGSRYVSPSVLQALTPRP